MSSALSKPPPVGTDTGSPVVTLVRPPVLTTALKLSTVAVPPIGVAYLAGALRAAGLRTAVIDAVGEDPERQTPLEWGRGLGFGLTWQETVARVPAASDIVGVSCMFSSGWPNDRRLLQGLRERFPKATLVIGGEHATACWEYVLRTCPAVDACVLGEGEETLVALVGAIRSGTRLADVPGIAFRAEDGRPRATPSRARIADIDGIARPAWDLMPIAGYLDRRIAYGARRVRSMPLLATRGCPYSCTFCSSPQMWTTRWSARDPEAVVDEMADHVQAYRVENFDLYDLTAIVDRRWIVAFTRAILARGLRITYQLPSGTRSEAVDAEVCDLLVASGCTNLNFAPETGSERTIRRLKKRVKLDRMLETIRTVCSRGLNVTVNLILFPNDTWDDVRDTWRFALRCAEAGAHDIMYLPYMPYPGSQLYAELQAEGRLPPMDEAYFAGLLDQFDLLHSTSYNPRVGTGALQLLRLGFFVGFHLAVYRSHPMRLLENARNLALRDPQSRGEKMLLDMGRRLARLNGRQR